MIREKVDAKSQEEKFVYDIYFTKSKDLHLDMLYSNNYEIKSSNYYDNIELVDEKNLVEGDEECRLFFRRFFRVRYKIGSILVMSLIFLAGNKVDKIGSL